MEHAERVRAGVAAWNSWREQNPEVLVDLRGADFADLDLHNARFDDCVLLGANLTGCNLRGGVFRRADLRGALLTNADLRRADLIGAVLADVAGSGFNAMVDISGADFTDAVFGRTVVGDLYLNRMIGLGRIRHVGPSYVATSTLELTLVETSTAGALRTDVELFLKGAGVLVEAFKQFEAGFRSHEYQSAFISYSHDDQAFAFWLHSELERQGVRCWLDEKNMLPGERILDAIGSAIGTHDRVLLCCSRGALESWWVQDEIRKVQDLERQSPGDLRILPILLDDHLLRGWSDGMASDLRSRLALDFRLWSHAADSSREVAKLLAALRKR